MSIKFRWLGNACYEIILPSGKVLVLDPYIDHNPNSPITCKEVTGADYIAITHGHHDHCADTGTMMQKFPYGKVMLNHKLANNMPGYFDVDPGRFIRMNANDEIEFDDLKIKALASVHVSQVNNMRAAYRRLTGERADPGMPVTELQAKIRELSPPRPEPPAEFTEMMKKMNEAGVVGDEQTNFTFTTPDNLCMYVYCAGAEEYLKNQVRESRANIIFMQLAGLSAEKAAEYAAMSGAQVVIPTHHDIQGLETGYERAKEMAEKLAERSSARLINTVPGTWYEIALTVTEL